MVKYNKKYDVVVVGGGHAGCEAALIASRMGCSVLLLAIDLDKIAALPCSPSIGGMAKGQLVREIDVLGGEMAKIADKTAMQYKTLNTKKGPAVRSTRTQNDKFKYHVEMKKVVEKQIGLDIKQTMVETLIIENNKIVGVEDSTGVGYCAMTVILATGTFLKGLIHIGTKCFEAGRAGEFASNGLSDSLNMNGFVLGKMKTGTPPRIDKFTIDFSKFVETTFDSDPQPFSYSTHVVDLSQVPSFMGFTNVLTHEIIGKNLHLSALYSGAIKGVPARYCPSLEDKIVRFHKRERHQVILEFEGLESQEIYVSGLGNSLPMDIQIEAVRSIVGFEEAEITRPAYAVEYDYINPINLKPTFESKLIENLYMAGQINGTSGYEEAAAQGIYAGINAACFVQGRPPFKLDRSEAYLGVMVDDLVTRGTTEPYRMFTSRAEYRLSLREDNTDLRLSKAAYELGLMSYATMKEIDDRMRMVEAEINRVNNTVIKPNENSNSYLKVKCTNPIKDGIKLGQLLKRTELDYDVVTKFSPSLICLDAKIIKQVEIEIKYEGYIKRQQSEIAKFRHFEKIKIPDNLDYGRVYGLSNELKEKLSVIRPVSLGQMRRVDGITPAAISVIAVYLKTFK